MIKETYQKKENRDARYKELKAQGLNVRRRSTGPARLHPEYIKDYQGAFQTGFGNTDYLTMFSNLYIVEAQEDSNSYIIAQDDPAQQREVNV